MEQGRCKHYNGSLALLMGESHCCHAGIDIRKATGGSDTGWFLRMPCRAETETQCKHYAEPTTEEVQASEAERKRGMDALIARMTILSPLIVKLKDENADEGGEGALDCPICKGVLRWSISSYNGHIRMQCETEQCVNFME